MADGKLYLRSRSLGRRLHVTDRAMLNWAGAPDPCRFMLEVSQGLSGTVSWFSWESLTWTMPFLPRVERGDLVLRRARWRLRPGDLAPASAGGDEERPADGEDGGQAAFATAVRAWAGTWLVPRLVNLTDNDNALLLDLTSAASLRELRDSLDRATEDGITLEEVLPAPDEGFLRDTAGEPYASEIVVPLVRTGKDPGPVARHIRPRTVPGAAEDPGARSKRIGSDWLAVKLYAEPDAHDTLLGVGLAGLTGRLAEQYGVPSPFFLRYGDPAPHLRVRFHVPEESARADVLREVTAWAYDLARGGHLADHTFVSYQREVERYGGPELIADCEGMVPAGQRGRRPAPRQAAHLRHRSAGTAAPRPGRVPGTCRAGRPHPRPAVRLPRPRPRGAARPRPPRGAAQRRRRPLPHGRPRPVGRPYGRRPGP
ncbi:thiopeptide-type bacteriocin biosynthesis protein [Streptomyces sp. GKU 257-1]|nr:thiopeptide-type bacteriocin biosynthesis protein [Streptomyces sp. GKU 257-1]